MKPVSVLPNLLTMANAACGLLALSKAIDALAVAGVSPERFDRLLEQGCWLIFLAMVFDALDGRVARMTDSMTDFGAQLDSFADAITFGVAPALMSKVLIEGAGEGWIHPRISFLAAASFALMAVLRLARFNLETDHDEESHKGFSGLPSPAAAGTIVAMILMFLSLGSTIEVGTTGDPTVVGRGVEFLPLWLRDGLRSVLLPGTLVALPLLGLLMVSRVPYAHAASSILQRRARFDLLVRSSFVAGGLYLAPVPVLFLSGLVYVLHGVLRHEVSKRRGHKPIPDDEREAA